MLKFYRNTHVDGQCRKDLPPHGRGNTLAMHLLDHDNGLNFDELVCEMVKYHKDNPEPFREKYAEKRIVQDTLRDLVNGLESTTIRYVIS